MVTFRWFPMSTVTPNETFPADEVLSTEPSFGDILSEFERDQRKGAGQSRTEQTVDGVVTKVTDESVYVAVGRKHDGVLPVGSLPATVKPGDHLKVSLGALDENGYHVLSLFKVVVPKDWSGLERALAEKSVISGTVVEPVKGGLRVDVGVRAFLPASRTGTRDQAEMEKLVGQTIEVRITKLDVAKEDVVVDRRGVLEERAAKERDDAFQSIEEGSVRSGVIRSLTEFGAFVDLGGVDGLLHVAEMSWIRGVKPADVVKQDDTVQVKVLKVDRERKKISLSLKALQPEPFAAAAESIQAGQKIRGKVVRVTDFGAFVELLPGVEGLIHVSALSWSRKQRKPSDVVKPGEMVEVVVLGIKPEERKISLSLRQALGDPWEDAVQKHPKGSIVEAPVSTLAAFGAFVELAEGIEGMIHISDMVSNRRLQHPSEVLKTGQIVRAQVTEIDPQRRQFRLSLKSLEPTSLDQYIAEHKVGDVVTGRVLESGANSIRVELGEGVTARCRPKAPVAAETPAPKPGADLGSSIAALAAKWKAGAVASSSASGSELKEGELRQFRILGMDAAKKSLEIELAD